MADFNESVILELGRLEDRIERLEGIEHQPEDMDSWRACVAAYLSLPALRGFWPMSSVAYTAADQAADLSGQGHHLTNVLVSLFGYDNLAPYVEFNGTTQYLSRADGGAANWADIIGTETYIVAAQRGLTIGGWFYFDIAAAAIEVMMSKWSVDPDRSYQIYREADGTVTLKVRGGGVTNTVISVATASAMTWYFIAGRFEPSTQVSIFVDSEETNNAVATIAAIDDSAVQFAIGARGDPANYTDGRASMCFLCAAALSDATILALYQMGRATFGV